MIIESVSQDMNPKTSLQQLIGLLKSKGVAVENYRVSVVGFLQQEKKKEKKTRQTYQLSSSGIWQKIRKKRSKYISALQQCKNMKVDKSF